MKGEKVGEVAREEKKETPVIISGKLQKMVSDSHHTDNRKKGRTGKRLCTRLVSSQGTWTVIEYGGRLLLHSNWGNPKKKIRRDETGKKAR